MALPTLPFLIFLTLVQTTLSHTLKPSLSSPKISNSYNKKPISFSTWVYNRLRPLQQSNTSINSPSKTHVDVHPISYHSIVMVVGIGKNSTFSPMLTTELFVDTGSGLTWLQGLPCNSCFNQGDFPFYNRSDSKSFAAVYCHEETCLRTLNDVYTRCGIKSLFSSEECSYEIEYLDLSWSSGVIGIETFYFLDGSSSLASVESVPFGIGNSNYIPNSFTGFPPGVVGLRRGYGTLIHKLGVKKFSHCFPREEDDMGILSFGEEAKIMGVKLDLNKRSINYEASLTNVYVANERLRVSYKIALPDTMVFDTGSSFTHLSPLLMDAVVEYIKNALRKYKSQQWRGFELCYNLVELTSVSLDEVAKVTFEFNYSTRINLFSYHLWTQHKERNLICLGFVRSYNVNIFGNNLMRELNIGYTLDEDDLAMYFNHQHCWN